MAETKETKMALKKEKHTVKLIPGFLMGVEMLGNVIGSPLAGWTYDTTGSYETIWLIYGGLVLIGLFIILTVPSSKTAAVESGAITS